MAVRRNDHIWGEKLPEGNCVDIRDGTAKAQKLPKNPAKIAQMVTTAKFAKTVNPHTYLTDAR